MLPRIFRDVLFVISRSPLFTHILHFHTDMGIVGTVNGRGPSLVRYLVLLVLPIDDPFSKYLRWNGNLVLLCRPGGL